MVTLSGNSGCSLEIITENRQSYVKKVSASKSYDERLLKQCMKQKDCSKLIGKSPLYNIVKIPSITFNNNNSFTMELFHGKDSISYFMECDIHSIDHFIDNVIKFVELEIENCTYSLFDPKVVTDKVYSVASRINGKSVIDPDRIVTYVESLPIINIPHGTCHGDLTLSNMLIGRDGQVCIIDFLDTFYETPIQDMVKIRQDTLYKWSSIVYNKNYDSTRYNMLMEYLDNSFDKFFSKFEYYKLYYNVFQLVNYYRILPYSKTKKIRDHVEANLQEIFQKCT